MRVCCSVLQCVAVCCSVLQCVAVCCSALQCVAVCCSVLQCVAVCCSVLQYVVVCCSVSQRTPVRSWGFQCGAVCCSVLQCVARFQIIRLGRIVRVIAVTFCLQRTATQYDTLRHTATYCNTETSVVALDLSYLLVSYVFKTIAAKSQNSCHNEWVVSHVSFIIHSHVTWLIYMWQDLFICVTWLIHVFDMSHSYERLSRSSCHEQCSCVTWLIHKCDMTHAYVCYDSSICDMTMIMCAITHPCAWHDTYISVTRLMHMRDMTHSYVPWFAHRNKSCHAWNRKFSVWKILSHTYEWVLSHIYT